MFNDVRDLLGDPNSFLDKIFLNLKDDGIDVSNFELDHLCYRTETVDEYYKISSELMAYGQLLSEAKINGRSISSYKLNLAIKYKEREIFCIEVPSPSSHKSYTQGYEHVEFVINEELSELTSRFKKLEFKMKGINKNVNPDISRKYLDGTTVKFHHNTLENIIKFKES